MFARRGTSGILRRTGHQATVYLAVCSLLGLAGIGAVASTAGTPAGAVGIPRDGLTAETAAPSCWSIKQNYPASTDGLYWLQTPKLPEPQQYHCDQTTDGGGWVLVGRGREGWSFQYWGQGSPSTVRTTITGSGAFAPATLSTPVVDGLMNGGRMDALTDGIRLRRATNTTGTTWQEVRMRVKTYGKWSWAFGGGIYLSSIKFDNTTTNLGTSNYQTNTTANVQVANDTRRVFTYPWANHNNRAGFSFGSSVTNGTNNATSYLWENANENSAIPFTQVFIRPQISEADVAAVASFAPDTGLPASTVRAMLDHRPTAQPWGVTGINNGTAIPSLNANVTAFADIGNTIYVGGKFLQVQHGIGGPTFNQPYLAAFDKTTGEWIPTFNPVLNGVVWEIKAAPDGTKLFVGGEFTSVNGLSNTTALAALNPTTGAPVSDWVGYVSRPTGAYDVRAMDVQGGFLYVAGNFTRVSGGTGFAFAGPLSNSRLARFRLSDGQPDWTWFPTVEVAPQDIDASPQGDRVYAVGLFQTLNGVTLNPTRLAIMDTTTGAAVPGLQPFQPNSTTSVEWQNAILEVGDKVYQGGSQHFIHQYNRSNYAFERSNMTKSGGDYQAITYRDGIVYAACHCNNWQYQDANTWSDPVGYSQVNPINMIGAYDTTSNFEVMPEFHTTQLDLTGSNGEGPWELFVDSDNCMWAGGDLMRLGTTASPFYGGFERFCGVDAAAPSTPTNAHTTVANNDVTLAWNASTDNATTPIRYEVLKDDPTFGTIVMGSTFERTFTDTNVVGPTRYFVRAADAEDNRSATTAVLNVTPPPPAAATLLASGATWSYNAAGQSLGSAWRAPAYDVSSWATGPAQLGWGDGDEATVIPSGTITQYFVKHIDVPNPSQYQTVTVRLLRDDGAAVYLNGIEVARDNLPPGPLNATTLASGFASGTQETTFFEFQVPASLLVSGDNTIAVELHQPDAANADASFDLELVARGGTETNPPSTPAPAASDVALSTLTVSWPAATDDTSVIGYLVRRNSTLMAFTTATSFLDSGLSPSTAYTYDITAVDGSGNLSAPGALTVTTPDAPTPDPDLFSDLFSGANGAAWGPAWTTTTSNGSATQQSGTGQLAVTNTANAFSQSLLSGLAARTNSETLFSYQYNSATAAASFSVFTRGSGGWQNGYRPRNGYGLEFTSSSGSVAVRRTVNGTLTTLSSVAGARQVSTAKQWVRLRVNGQTIQFRTWVDGQTEPTTWAATLTDSMVSAAGQLHLSLVRGGSNTGLKNVQIDDLRITDPAANPPTAPTGLAASNVGQTQATLTWNAATDNEGVTGYQVVRNGVVLPASISGLTYTDTGLAPSTSYTYTVRAFDAAGNVGGDSNSVPVTTLTPPDMTPPSAPTGLAASNVGQTQATLTWNAATDNVGVTGYQVVRNGVVLPASISGLTYTDTGLAPGASYTYTVRAFDAAGNVGGDSNSVPVTTLTPPDMTPPSAPTGLAASNVGQTQATLTWNTATDNVGVTGYQVVRNGVVLPASISGLTYTDTGLAPGASYTYTVRAFDAAGNVGGDSNSVPVTTLTTSPELFSDLFSGADGAAWGPAWTTTTSSGSATLQAGTGQLAMTDTANAYSRSLLSGLAARTNSETLFSYRYNSAAAVAYFSVFARGSGGWQNGYRPRNGYGLEFTSNSGTVTVKRNVNGTVTTLSSVAGARQVSTAKQWVRLRVNGQTIQFRTWVDGQTEPTTWAATLTDSMVSAAGQLHLSLVRGGTNTGLKNVQIDDLRVTDTA